MVQQILLININWCIFTHFLFYIVWFLIKSHIYDFNSTYSIELCAILIKKLYYISRNNFWKIGICIIKYNVMFHVKHIDSYGLSNKLYTILRYVFLIWML